MTQFQSNHSPVAHKPTYRLLMISDDAVNTQQIAPYLVKAGLESRFASGAAAGLAAFRENNIHVVLVDLSSQPEAEALCARIRQSSTKPLIVLSNQPDKEAQLRSLKVGADDYIARSEGVPLVVASIFALIRRAYIYGPEEDHTQPSRSASPSNPPQTLSAAYNGPGGQTQYFSSSASLSNTGHAPQLPAGWASCEGCNYMGPVQKFENQDNLGQAAMICPHCRTRATVTYAVT